MPVRSVDWRRTAATPVRTAVAKAWERCSRRCRPWRRSRRTWLLRVPLVRLPVDPPPQPFQVALDRRPPLRQADRRQTRHRVLMAWFTVTSRYPSRSPTGCSTPRQTRDIIGITVTTGPDGSDVVTHRLPRPPRPAVVVALELQVPADSARHGAVVARWAGGESLAKACPRLSTAIARR